MNLENRIRKNETEKLRQELIIKSCLGNGS